MEWIKNLNPIELENSLFSKYPVRHTDLTYDELGQEVASIIAMRSNLHEQGFGSSSQIWEIVKKEFRLLVCEQDSKYKDIKEKLDKLSSDSSTAFVAILSAGLGAAIGTVAAVISPLVTILVIAMLRIGKESFCTYKNLNSKADGKK